MVFKGAITYNMRKGMNERVNGKAKIHTHMCKAFESFPASGSTFAVIAKKKEKKRANISRQANIKKKVSRRLIKKQNKKKEIKRMRKNVRINCGWLTNRLAFQRDGIATKVTARAFMNEP